MRSSLFPVTPTFGPGLDLGVSVSMRPPTAADNLSNSALEIRSGGVDGILSVFSTLLPSRNRLLLLPVPPEGRVVDPRSLFLIPVSAAIITPGRSRAQYRFYKYVAFTPHTTSKQFEIPHRLMRPSVPVLNGKRHGEINATSATIAVRDLVRPPLPLDADAIKI